MVKRPRADQVGRQILWSPGYATPTAAAGVEPASEGRGAVGRIAKQYQQLEHRRAQLLVRSGEIDDWLTTHTAWSVMTRAQRRSIPEAQTLADLDDELEQIGRELARLVEQLPETPAHTFEAAMGKLRIVASEIDRDDYPAAHRVLTPAVAELEALTHRLSLCELPVGRERVPL